MFTLEYIRKPTAIVCSTRRVAGQLDLDRSRNQAIPTTGLVQKFQESPLGTLGGYGFRHLNRGMQGGSNRVQSPALQR